MDAKNVNIRDLQQLNDAIAYTMDAIQRISPQVQSGLAHSAYGQMPFGTTPYIPTQVAVDPFGVVRGIDHTAFAGRTLLGNPLVNPMFAQAGYGLGVQPFGGAIDPYTREALARGLGHTGTFGASPFNTPFNGALSNLGGWGNVQYVPVRTW